MWARNAAPGDYFTYCNLDWGVIGTIMERVTGERFDRLMQRLLLDPLGIHGGYNPSEFSAADLANLATIYRKRTVDTEVWDAAGPWIAQVDDYSARPPQPPAGIDSYVPGTNATPFSPTGGLRISAHGMGQVMLMLMNGGVHQGTRMLQPATIALCSRASGPTTAGGNGDTNSGLFTAGAWATSSSSTPPAAAGRRRRLRRRSATWATPTACARCSCSTPPAATAWWCWWAAPRPIRMRSRAAHSALARFEERILAAL